MWINLLLKKENKCRILTGKWLNGSIEALSRQTFRTQTMDISTGLSTTLHSTCVNQEQLKKEAPSFISSKVCKDFMCGMVVNNYSYRMCAKIEKVCKDFIGGILEWRSHFILFLSCKEFFWQTIIKKYFICDRIHDFRKLYKCVRT